MLACYAMHRLGINYKSSQTDHDRCPPQHIGHAPQTSYVMITNIKPIVTGHGVIMEMTTTAKYEFE
jgi:hypothetical protein